MIVVYFRENGTEKLIYDTADKSYIPRAFDIVSFGLRSSIQYMVVSVRFNYQGRKLASITVYMDELNESTRTERTQSQRVSV